MKEIPLTQGYATQVDDNDFELLSKFNWYVLVQGSKVYATRWQKPRRMHRVIMQPPDSMQVDHIDGNGLNNQRSNLRVCTQTENNRNTGKLSNNKSGYKGVSWYKQTKKWKAQIRVDRKFINLGYFLSKEDAHKAYCVAAKEHHGEFANVN